MKNKKMTKPAIVTYKVYWKNDSSPLVIRGKSFAIALRLAGFNLNKVKDGIDYYTSSDSIDGDNSET